jgi:hypothetical protein
MPFACASNAIRDMPSIGSDCSPAYGNAQEHDSLVLWSNLWIDHECDLLEHGTPPTSRRLIDQPTSAGTNAWETLIPLEIFSPDQWLSMIQPVVLLL